MSELVATVQPRLLRRPWIYLAIACLVLLAHQAFYYQDLGAYAVDDAYISFRYAQNLVNGHGLVFNPGERVEGYTNFLWTVVVALFLWLGLDPSAVAIGLGVLFSLGTLWLAFRFARVASLSNPVIPIVATFGLALDGSFALWAVSGMESSMFTFLILAALTCYVWEWRKRKPGLLSGALLALAAMTRPEGVLVLGVVVVHQALARLITDRQLLSEGDVVRWGAFAILYLPYFLWRYYYYGFLLPNTFYVKVTVQDSTAQQQRGLQHLATFAGLHQGWIMGPLLLVAVLKRRFAFWCTALLSVLLVYLGYIVYVGGDWSVGRFFVPTLPFVYILLATGIAEAYETLAEWLRRLTSSRGAMLSLRCAVMICLLAGAAILFWSSSLRGEHDLYVSGFQAAKASQARVAMGQWLRDHVPGDTFIAVDAAGQIPYYADLQTLDMFGVNDVHTGHLEVETMGEGVPGHEKFDFDYIMWRGPDLIVATAAFLEGSDLYERLEIPWTDDPSLFEFLFVYGRKGWSGWE
jgi:arabinofuranosyltransferase